MKNVMIMGALGAAIVASSAIGGWAASDAGRDGHKPRHSFEELDANSDGSLTREEMTEHMRARFDRVDSNGDGSLSRDEIAAQGAERMAKRADKMIKRLDADGDNAVSFEEMQARRGGKMFERADADGNGAISKAEFDAAREKMHKRHKSHDHGKTAKPAE